MKTYAASASLQLLILSVMEKVYMDIPVKEDNCGINMSYNFVSKTIGYDPKRLVSAHQEMAPFCSLQTYVKTITLHELGHALDQKALDASLTRTLEIFTMKKNYSMRQIFSKPELFAMLIEEHEMNIAFEETAWVNAAALNERFHIVNFDDFEVIRKMSLATYKKLYLEAVKLCEKLLSVQKVDPVA
ncbi:integrase [Bacillus sp. FJAT-50079]|uniref:integrase n=1 Tax=Bacillus sp. FJAT-50079 TaxID=2833577 RepID=UPI001BC8FDFE|nr:integrase [Bacillus sp. FJAT-50079]MBS4210596.1 integrase [Bacillus sp. FJAT-50079]